MYARHSITDKICDAFRLYSHQIHKCTRVIQSQTKFPIWSNSGHNISTSSRTLQLHLTRLAPNASHPNLVEQPSAS